jgi:hypothetical protein
MKQFSIWFTEDKSECTLISLHQSAQDASLMAHILIFRTPGLESIVYENYYGIIEINIKKDYGGSVDKREYFIISDMEGQIGEVIKFYNLRFPGFYAPAQSDFSKISKTSLLEWVG